MKICPNCGFQDDPAWRNRHYDPHAEIMNWDDFQAKYPEIAKVLEERKTTSWNIGKATLIFGRQPYPPKKPRMAVRLTVQEFAARGHSLRLQLERGSRLLHNYGRNH